MKKRLLVLTGASGAGKTTIANAVRTKPGCGVDVFFFDSIGVPSAERMLREYGGGEAWQRAMTLAWVQRLAARLETVASPVLLEGQTRFEFIQEAAQSTAVSCSIILADCNDRIRTERLAARGQPELASAEMLNWARYLREEALSGGHTILDTGKMSIEESAEYICARAAEEL